MLYLEAKRIPINGERYEERNGGAPNAILALQLHPRKVQQIRFPQDGPELRTLACAPCLAPRVDLQAYTFGESAKIIVLEVHELAEIS